VEGSAPRRRAVSVARAPAEHQARAASPHCRPAPIRRVAGTKRKRTRSRRRAQAAHLSSRPANLTPSPRGGGLRFPDRALGAGAPTGYGGPQDGREDRSRCDLLPRGTRADRGHWQDEKAAPSCRLDCAGREVSEAGRDRARGRQGDAAVPPPLLLVACLPRPCAHGGQGRSQATRGVRAGSGPPAAPSVSVRIPLPSRADFSPATPLAPESGLRPVGLRTLGASMNGRVSRAKKSSERGGEGTVALGNVSGRLAHVAALSIGRKEHSLRRAAQARVHVLTYRIGGRVMQPS